MLVSPFVPAFRGPHGMSATMPGLTIAYWVRMWDLAMLAELERLNAAQIKASAQGLVMITGFRTEALDHRAFGDERVRQRISALLEKTGPHLRCSVTVLEGEGFIASAIRSASMGFFLVSRQRFKQRFCANGREAAQFIVDEGFCPPSLDVVSLAQAYESVREEALQKR